MSTDTRPDADRIGTHWIGCWRDRDHHDCAIARVEKARVRVREYYDALAEWMRLPVVAKEGGRFYRQTERDLAVAARWDAANKALLEVLDD